MSEKQRDFVPVRLHMPANSVLNLNEFRSKSDGVNDFNSQRLKTWPNTRLRLWLSQSHHVAQGRFTKWWHQLTDCVGLRGSVGGGQLMSAGSGPAMSDGTASRREIWDVLFHERHELWIQILRQIKIQMVTPAARTPLESSCKWKDLSDSLGIFCCVRSWELNTIWIHVRVGSVHKTSPYGGSLIQRGDTKEQTLKQTNKQEARYAL